MLNVQDSWQQQRELTLVYARFYGALLLGILLTYQLQKCASAALYLLCAFWYLQAVADLSSILSIRPRHTFTEAK